jgi:protein CMS1
MLTGADALSLEKLERVVIDGSHIDQKKRGILDMKETQVPLMHFLNLDGLKDQYGSASNRVDILVY